MMLSGSQLQRAATAQRALQRYASSSSNASSGAASRRVATARTLTSSAASRTPSTSNLLSSPPILRASKRPHLLPIGLAGSSRSISLWTPGNSPAPIIGPDGKLVKDGAAAASTPPATLGGSEVQADSVAADAAGTATDAAGTVTDAASVGLTHTLQTIPFEDSVETTRRTLQEYGLGGSGITGRIQELLEWVHLTTGLPWWATIGSVVVAVRIALLPIMVKGIANNARLAHIQPKMMANIAKIKKANQERNQLEAQRLQLETKQLFVDHNCGPLRGLIPPLVQMPLFISFFFALRGMAGAGLPDFKTGGLSWFMDLGAPDPYYILPVLSSAATLAILQVGEFGMPERQGVAKGVTSAIKLATPAIAYVASTFPAGVLVYWVTHNTFSVFQSLLLRLPAFKRWANIPDPPVRDPAAPSDAVGFRKAFRDTTEAFSEVYEGAVERTNRKMSEKEEAKAKKDEAEEFEKRRKAAALKLKETPVSAATAEQQGDTTVATFTPIQASPEEEAKRRRLADARRRREQSRSKRSRV